MGVRFCSQCGARSLAVARFCAECGAPLDRPAAAERRGGWQVTLAGSAVLVAFLAAGLTIWTTIVVPGAPRPLPGAGARAGTPKGGAPAEGRSARTELPAEVKTFIADLAS